MTKPKHPSQYKKRGAPEWPYDDVFGRKICDAVATCTDPMKKIIEDNGFPCQKVINKWRLSFPSFGQMYAQAKMQQAELFAEEIIEISDYSAEDLIEDKDGNLVTNHEVIQRARLRCDSRKWVACKLAPKIYGEKQTVEQHTYTHEDGLKDLA